VTTTASPRLTSERYLQLLAADGRRLAEVSEGRLDNAVPPCPGWDVAEVVRHTGSVYHHKLACMELMRRPEDGEWPTGPPSDDLLGWYLEALASILGGLDRDPAAPSYTWYPPEQHVGFWQRRMAQETAVHRVDAESATGQVTAVDDDLAVDGVDEVLDVFVRYAVGDDPDEDVRGLDGLAWVVRTGPWAWHLAVRSGAPEGQIELRRGAGRAEATVSGEPSELLLWLWGRRPDSAVTTEGDPVAAAKLRALLARATQ
jgi:uncharacterized protein (TIGR03083 family)